jgi:hypothetical protein
MPSHAKNIFSKAEKELIEGEGTRRKTRWNTDWAIYCNYQS